MTVRCVAFDFDGTLVNSNAIKKDAFFVVTRQWPDAEASLSSILAAPNPGSRKEIFEKLAMALLNRTPEAQALAAQWTEAYTLHCEEAISVAPEVQGAGHCLRLLKDRGLSIYVNSATPEGTLRTIVKRRGIAAFFNGIYGLPGSKVENLRRICADANCQGREVLFVGDSEMDREAASELGCEFAPVESNGVPDLIKLIEQSSR